MIIYECWQGEAELSFMPADHAQHDFLTLDVEDKQMTHIYSLRAESWDEALSFHHEIQGWRPYQPMEEE